MSIEPFFEDDDGTIPLSEPSWPEHTTEIYSAGKPPEAFEAGEQAQENAGNGTSIYPGGLKDEG